MKEVAFIWEQLEGAVPGGLLWDDRSLFVHNWVTDKGLIFDMMRLRGVPVAWDRETSWAVEASPVASYRVIHGDRAWAFHKIDNSADWFVVSYGTTQFGDDGQPHSRGAWVVDHRDLDRLWRHLWAYQRGA